MWPKSNTGLLLAKAIIISTGMYVINYGLLGQTVLPKSQLDDPPRLA